MSTFNLYKIFLLTEPTKCQDLETGTFYKVGAEWYSKDTTLCLKMSCTPNFFPEVTVTRYVLKTLPPQYQWRFILVDIRALQNIFKANEPFLFLWKWEEGCTCLIMSSIDETKAIFPLNTSWFYEHFQLHTYIPYMLNSVYIWNRKHYYVCMCR